MNNGLTIAPVLSRMFECANCFAPGKDLQTYRKVEVGFCAAVGIVLQLGTVTAIVYDHNNTLLT